MEYSDVWDTKKEALLTVTNFQSAVKDINTVSQLVSRNSNNKQFITKIGEIMPRFMDNIKQIMQVAADNYVPGIVSFLHYTAYYIMYQTSSIFINIHLLYSIHLQIIVIIRHERSGSLNIF